jgi:hypothetical protein
MIFDTHPNKISQVLVIFDMLIQHDEGIYKLETDGPGIKMVLLGYDLHGLHDDMFMKFRKKTS